MTGKNWFFDRPITDEALRRFPKFESDLGRIASFNYKAIPRGVWETLDDATKNVLGGYDNGDGTLTINPYSLAALTFLVPGFGRANQTLSSLAREDIDTARKIGRTISGIRVQGLDPKKSLAFDRRKQLENFVEVEGLADTMKKLELRRLIDRADEEEE